MVNNGRKIETMSDNQMDNEDDTRQQRYQWLLFVDVLLLDLFYLTERGLTGSLI